MNGTMVVVTTRRSMRAPELDGFAVAALTDTYAILSRNVSLDEFEEKELALRDTKSVFAAYMFSVNETWEWWRLLPQPLATSSFPRRAKISFE